MLDPVMSAAIDAVHRLLRETARTENEADTREAMRALVRVAARRLAVALGSGAGGDCGQ